ncbi:MAG: hypothetical protein ACTHMM_16690 [Agriterribacter sp.]
MQHKHQLKEALNALKHAYFAVDELITSAEVRPLKGKILSTLQREINLLATSIAEPLLNSQLNAVTKPQPLRSFLGRPLSAAVPVASGNYAREQTPPSIKTLTADEVALLELRAAAEILYTQIPRMDNAAVIDSNSDLEIRAVAKMAGLPVTEDNPKSINTAYIDKIKEAIAKKNAPPVPDNSPAQITEPNEAHQKEDPTSGSEPAAGDANTEGATDAAKTPAPDAQPAAKQETAKTQQETTSKTSSNKGKGK